MTTRKLSKDQWHTYFQNLSEVMPAHEVRIEALHTGIGDQIDAEREVVSKIDYNSASGALHIYGKDRGHLVLEPTAITIEGEVAHLKALEVVDKDNVKHILTFKPLAALPLTEQNDAGKKSGRHGPQRSQQRSQSMQAEGTNRHEIPEVAACDRCGVSFLYVKEMVLDEEEQDDEILCSSCRTLRYVEADGLLSNPRL